MNNLFRVSSFIAIKELTYNISSNQLIFYRFFFSGIILLIIFHQNFLKLKLKEIVLGFIGGIFLYLAFLSQTIGINYTSIPKQAFITSLYILFIPIFEYIFYKKKFYKKINLIGIILGLFFIFFDDISKFKINFNKGDFLTLLCALFFALNIIIFKNKQNLNIFNVTIIQFFTVTFFSYFSSVILDKKIIPLEYKYFNKYIFFLIIFCTLINFLFQNISQKKDIKNNCYYCSEKNMADKFKRHIKNIKKNNDLFYNYDDNNEHWGLNINNKNIEIINNNKPNCVAGNAATFRDINYTVNNRKKNKNYDSHIGIYPLCSMNNVINGYKVANSFYEIDLPTILIFFEKKCF